MDFELQHAYDAIIESWMRTLGLKDQQLEDHAVRVSELSTALASSLSVKSDELLQLRSGALLHDVGKIVIPDAILNKPNKLTDKERNLVRLHPEFGFEILAPIPFLQSAAEIAHYHHENWDGTGYPRELKGEKIPLMARIVSVCNVFDMLVTEQPYRPSWHQKAALSYIQERAGKQFDPEIVKAFVRLTSHEN